MLVAGSQHYYPSDSAAASDYGLSFEEFSRRDRILLKLTEDRFAKACRIGCSGILKIEQEPFSGCRYRLPSQSSESTNSVPTILVSQELAERVVSGSDYSLEEVRERIRTGNGQHRATLYGLYNI